MADPNLPPHPSTPANGATDPDPVEDLLLVDDGVGSLEAFAEEIKDYEPVGLKGTAEDRALSRDALEAELAKVRARLEGLQKAETDHQDRHTRLMADFANHRNRVGRETQLAVTLAERKLLAELLPVMDSLERCAGAKYSTVEDFHAGVLLIQKQCLEALKKAGVEALDVKIGDPFDAQHAEALTTTHQPGLPDGSVAAVYERGYLLHDQLLRPARVIVNNVPDGDVPQNPS